MWPTATRTRGIRRYDIQILFIVFTTMVKDRLYTTQTGTIFHDRRRTAVTLAIANPPRREFSGLRARITFTFPALGTDYRVIVLRFFQC